MNFEGTPRQLARRIVDDFCYDLHHSGLDLSKTNPKTVTACTDAIEKLIKEAKK